MLSVDAILELRIIDGPVPVIVYALAVACVLYLLIRPPTVRWILTASIGILSGAALGVALYLFVDRTKILGASIPIDVLLWLMGTLAAIGLAIVNLWNSRWWRKVVAGVSIPVFALAGSVGINAVYGVDNTVADVLGVVVSKPIDLPTPRPTQTQDARPLYETWTPPADMPAAGTIGTVTIPGTTSGFTARDAGIYLPPAALVQDAPALPLLVFMLGYPGTPDPGLVVPVLDAFAAAHDGLAPIVIVADQIGDGLDPACADSQAYGYAETYIREDVPAWARQNLHIQTDPQGWSIGGYSSGGVCAVKYAALDPTQWRTLLAVSPEEFPGVEYADRTLQAAYGGDQAAFDAAKPAAILAANTGRFAGVTAAFTTGEEDGEFGPGTRRLADAAQAAGMDMTLIVIPGAGHTGSALGDGLAAALAQVAPALGLAPPQ